MKKFFEEYGRVILVCVVVISLTVIGVCTRPLFAEKVNGIVTTWGDKAAISLLGSSETEEPIPTDGGSEGSSESISSTKLIFGTATDGFFETPMESVNIIPFSSLTPDTPIVPQRDFVDLNDDGQLEMGEWFINAVTLMTGDHKGSDYLDEDSGYPNSKEAYLHTDTNVVLDQDLMYCYESNEFIEDVKLSTVIHNFDIVQSIDATKKENLVAEHRNAFLNNNVIYKIINNEPDSWGYVPKETAMTVAEAKEYYGVPSTFVTYEGDTVRSDDYLYTIQHKDKFYINTSEQTIRIVHAN